MSEQDFLENLADLSLYCEKSSAVIQSYRITGEKLQKILAKANAMTLDRGVVPTYRPVSREQLQRFATTLDEAIGQYIESRSLLIDYRAALTEDLKEAFEKQLALHQIDLKGMIARAHIVHQKVMEKLYKYQKEDVQSQQNQLNQDILPMNSTEPTPTTEFKLNESQLRKIYGAINSLEKKLNTILELLKPPQAICVFCPTKNSHYSHQCRAYTDIVLRTNRLCDLKRCILCLKPEHSEPCMFKCAKCHGPHHKLLCSSPAKVSVQTAKRRYH